MKCAAARRKLNGLRPSTRQGSSLTTTIFQVRTHSLKGVYSYFNGLAPDNIFFHTVYCQLAAKELGRLGFETSFDVVPIDTKSAELWKGVERRYWWGDTYFLPTCVLDEGTKGS